MIPITENFYWEESVCRCGCVMPDDVKREVRLTARWAEEIRAKLGGNPMRILSWYRCSAYNTLVGGVPASQHLLGKAMDFVIKALPPRSVQVMIVVDKLYPSPIRGLGKYAGWTHIDRRAGQAATWDG